MRAGGIRWWWRPPPAARPVLLMLLLLPLYRQSTTRAFLSTAPLLPPKQSLLVSSVTDLVAGRNSVSSSPSSSLASTRQAAAASNDTETTTTTATRTPTATLLEAERGSSSFLQKAVLFNNSGSSISNTTLPTVGWVSSASTIGDQLPSTTATSSTATATARKTKLGTRRKAEIHRLPGIRRVHCISDLHVDHADNFEWLVRACSNPGAEDASNTTTTATSNPENRLGPTDLVVVAGDISHVVHKIEASLKVLKSTGASVVFVPGNHEAWLETSSKTSTTNSSEPPSSYHRATDSVAKLEDIEKLCRSLGVYTTGDCVCVGDSDGEEEEELWILPLDSWYDGSLSFVDLDDASPAHNDHLVRDFGRWPWVDFLRCRWPEFLYGDDHQREMDGGGQAEDSSSDTKHNKNHDIGGAGETLQQQPPPPRSRLLRRIPSGLVDYFLERNQPTIDAFHEAVRQDNNNNNNTAVTNFTDAANNQNKNKKISVMTVTHFLPNQQSLPDWKDLEASNFDCDRWLDHGAGGLSAKFALVAGSSGIDDQIRSIGYTSGGNTIDIHRRWHVFGHSHRPKDFLYGGIRYVHHPLGKPSERDMHMVDPSVAVKPLWEKNTKKNGGLGGDNNENFQPILRYWEEHGGGLEMLVRRIEANRRNRKRRSRKHHGGGGGGGGGSDPSKPRPRPNPNLKP